jgi:CBS domain-containing protein
MNSIVSRIADILKKYPPFNYLSAEDLSVVAMNIRVVNIEKNKTLFQVNDTLHDSFYLVASGVVNLSVISDSEETILNKCIEGDVFGLRPFFAKNNYMMTAKAREESVVFAIPISTFRPFVAKNTDVLNFLLESFANSAPNTMNGENNQKLISDNVVFSSKPSEMQYFQTLTYNRLPLKVSSLAAVKEVAELMTSKLINNVVVVSDGFPIGIVTDSDMRSKIATGRFSIDTMIDKIMSVPVITVPESVSLAEAQLLMLKHNVSHLCVTQDGSDKSEIKGMITEHDLVEAQANNPGVLIKEIKRAIDAKELRKVRAKLADLIQTSLSKNIPLIHVTNISSEITLALIKRSVELAILGLGSPPVPFAWMSLGSQGRKEQLLLSDQDSMLVFEDVSANKYRTVRDYFINLAKATGVILEGIGYSTCPNGHVASNMNWCKSVTEWENQYTNWMTAPGEKNNAISSVFFDLEIVFGDSKIEDTLMDLIFKKSKRNDLFFDYLGNDALHKPAPLSFFKKFNLEEEGIHINKFDIKTKGLLPLIDSARLLALSNNIRGINNTYLRFKQLAFVDSKNADVYLNCAEAFLVLSKFRTLEGLKNDNSGQFLTIEDISKIDKEKLKNALQPMKDLEELIKDTFRLTHFS